MKCCNRTAQHDRSNSGSCCALCCSKRVQHKATFGSGQGVKAHPDALPATANLFSGQFMLQYRAAA